MFGCPQNGKKELKEVLRAIPITSEKQASLLLSICEMYELEAEFQNELKTAVADLMAEKNLLCGALRWYIDANQFSTASGVSDSLLVCHLKTFSPFFAIFDKR